MEADLRPLTVARAWQLPHAGHLEGLAIAGHTVVMGLIGDARSPHVDMRADADMLGVLNLTTGVLEALPEVNPGWVEEAVAFGRWLIRRETTSMGGGCHGGVDCREWRLYVQPLNLSAPPRLLAASSAPGRVIDEPNVVSDGRVAVWQQRTPDGDMATVKADLPYGHPVVVAHSYDSAQELALDNAGNVLIDSPLQPGSAATTLLRANLKTHRVTRVGLDDAHYPTVLGNRLVTVTNGTRTGLTAIQASVYSPTGPARNTRVINTALDEYDAQQVSGRLVLALNLDGLIVVDVAARTKRRLPVDHDSRASVSSAPGRVVFAVERGRGEAIVVARTP